MFLLTLHFYTLDPQLEGSTLSGHISYCARTKILATFLIIRALLSALTLTVALNPLSQTAYFPQLSVPLFTLDYHYKQV